MSRVESGGRSIDSHFAIDVPGPTDEVSIVINAIATEREPTAVDRLVFRETGKRVPASGDYERTNLWHDTRAGVASR